MHWKRQAFDNSDSVRDSDPDNGGVTEIWIQSSICKHPNTIRLDPAPLYDQTTGFCVRPCPICGIIRGIRRGRFCGGQGNCSRGPCLSARLAATWLENYLLNFLNTLYNTGKERTDLWKLKGSKPVGWGWETFPHLPPLFFSFWSHWRNGPTKCLDNIDFGTC